MGLEIITSQLWKRTGQQVVSPIQATIIIFKINLSIEKGFLPIVACSRLRDSGAKSFSKKKCKKRAGAGERFLGSTAPFPKSRASYFRFARFNTSAIYYLRAWHRLFPLSSDNLQRNIKIAHFFNMHGAENCYLFCVAFFAMLLLIVDCIFIHSRMPKCSWHGKRLNFWRTA